MLIMLQYAICEILGKQYKILPGHATQIGWQKNSPDTVEAKVLLLNDGKIKIGNPYLKEKLILKSQGVVSGEKIRVSKYQAKANYRKVKGYRKKFIKVILDVKKR